MSASHDKTQKFTFVYSNLYQIYKKQDAVQKNSSVGISKSQVLKAEDLHSAPVKISDFRPTEFIGKRLVVPKPEVLSTQKHHVEAVAGLKENLKSLNDLHGRLRVMLKELEELTKE
jgi:hypothetical protein